MPNLLKTSFDLDVCNYLKIHSNIFLMFTQMKIKLHFLSGQ